VASKGTVEGKSERSQIRNSTYFPGKREVFTVVNILTVWQAIISVTETTVVCLIVIYQHAIIYELEFATDVIGAALNIYCRNIVNIMQLCDVCESIQTRYSERLGTVNSLATCISLCNALCKLHCVPHLFVNTTKRKV